MDYIELLSIASGHRHTQIAIKWRRQQRKGKGPHGLAAVGRGLGNG